MSILWTNNAASVLTGDITAGTLSISVTAGQGDRFPAVASPHYFMATLLDASGNREIVKVTARTSGSNTMTIERAQEGTSARAFATGDIVELRITKNAMDHLSKAADINAQHYVCDASAADQGAAVNSASLKSIVDSLGATEEATIDLPHTGTGDTTTYTVGTNLTIPATVTLRVHKGVRISPSGGVTLTVNGIVQAGAFQIFAGAGTVTVSTYPQDQSWWGSAQRLDVTGLSIGTKTLAIADNTTVSAFAATVLDDTTAAAARATLGALAASDLTAASESVAGLAELATQAEVDAGTDDARIVTPKKLADYAEHRGMKNLLINGCMRVCQRGSQPLDVQTRYGLDRWYVFWGASAGVTPGTQKPTSTTYLETTSCMELAGLTCTGTNSIHVNQRIESANAKTFLNGVNHGKWSGQFKFWHNFGSSVNVYLSVYSANAADNFSAITVRYVSSAQSVPTSTWTSLKFEGIDIQTTDMYNGLQFSIKIETPVCSGNTIRIGDAQFEIGPKCTTIERRPYGLELALCQRYYEVSGGRTLQSAIISSDYVNFASYRVTKRAAPTVSITAYSSGTAGCVRDITANGDIAATCAGHLDHLEITGAMQPAHMYGIQTWAASAEL